MRRFDRSSLAALLLIVLTPLVSRPPGAQERVSPDPARQRALVEARKGDFDYLLGDWRFTARNAEYGEFGGFWSAVRLPTGEGANVFDEYRIADDSGRTFFASSTLRAYNPALDRWELVSVHEVSGLADFGTARKVGNEMHIEQSFGVAAGKPERWRIRYFDIHTDHFRWTADRSLDDGRTWERGYMHIEARRIGPPRSLPPLAPPRIAGR